MGDYRSLKVWQKAHFLTLAVYQSTEGFPKSEMYGLTSQIRRSAASIPANIAEGCGRNSDTELARFCRISLGSANELDYHLLLACDLGFLAEADQLRLAGDLATVKRMLANFIGTLSADS